jgi:transposase InsO family protein
LNYILPPTSYPKFSSSAPLEKSALLETSTSHRSSLFRDLDEEEVWTSEYRSLPEARENISRYLEEYNHDRPHRGVENRTPREAFLAFEVLTKNEALNV